MTERDMTEAQKRFNETYITSREICKDLQVTRMSLSNAHKTGKIPEPIIIDDTIMFIWERETIKPALEKWKAEILLRRNK